MSKSDKFLEKALFKLFFMVGRKYTPEAVGHPEWFYESTWTAAQQEEYREWFQKASMRSLGWRAKRARVEAGFFILWYGWKVELPHKGGAPDEVRS